MNNNRRRNFRSRQSKNNFRRRKTRPLFQITVRIILIVTEILTLIEMDLQIIFMLLKKQCKNISN